MKSNKIALLILVLSLLAGCGGSGGGGVIIPPTLVSIAVTPSSSSPGPSPSIALGIAEQFRAAGTYSDGTIQDLTTSVTWTSSDLTVATISNSAGLHGLATSKGTGTTTIAAASGKIVSAPVILTVNPAALVSIDVEPAFSSISLGASEQYTAVTGTFSDGLQHPLLVTWTSTAPDVATIDSSSGLATSSIVTSGTTLIAARSGNAPGAALLTVGTGTATANNVLPITVNGALCSAVTSSNYLNKPCVSVTVCTHGTSTCDTINDILLDTGSYGLRIFKSVLKNASPSQELVSYGTHSYPLAECAQFGDGSSLWGPVEYADVVLGNETAPNVPIQVIDSSAFGTRPAGCENAGSEPVDAGFNGILGVGLFAQDCGEGCQMYPNNGMYYFCSKSSCVGTVVFDPDQVSNPVALLSPDYNNGVIVELPSVSSAGTTSVSGVLVLGIDTKPNNSSSGATEHSADNSIYDINYGEITTVLNGIPYYSVIDSGSNGLFFTAPSRGLLPDCTSQGQGWFCPSSVTTLSATNEGINLVPKDVFFQIGNLDTLTSPPNPNMVFSDIGAPVPGLFDWGLPFYFGRSVYVGIDGTSSGLGLGPYFAY